MQPTVREIPLTEIKTIVSRAREKEGYAEMRESMREDPKDPSVGGLHVPIEVIDHGRKDAKGFRYSLVKGEGRTAAAEELGWKTIPAVFFAGSNAEIAGRSLVENLIRKPLAWARQGRMIRNQMKGGTSFGDVAKLLHISPGHAQKCIRVLDKAAPELVDVVAGMTMNEAEVFTTLPARGQKIVIEVVKTTGAGVAEVTRKARELSEKKGVGWTLESLRGTIKGTKKKLEAAQKRLKVLRLHNALGPGNLKALLADKAFKTALQKAKISTAAFEETLK